MPRRACAWLLNQNALCTPSTDEHTHTSHRMGTKRKETEAKAAKKKSKAKKAAKPPTPPPAVSSSDDDSTDDSSEVRKRISLSVSYRK